MPEQLKVSVQVAVAGGTPISASRSFEVSAYDRISINVPGAAEGSASSTVVEVQPSSNSGRVIVFAVTSDRYSSKLKYWVDVPPPPPPAEPPEPDKIILDTAHVLTGGAVALLRKAPQKLHFTNEMGDENDANITILVGRQAT